MKKQKWVNFVTREYFGVFLRADGERPVALFEFEDHAAKWIKSNYGHRGDVEIETVLVMVSRKVVK